MKTVREFVNESTGERIRLVVIDEHTLGYLIPELPGYAGVIHASKIRHSPFNNISNAYIKNSKIRTATKKILMNIEFHLKVIVIKRNIFINKRKIKWKQ